MLPLRSSRCSTLPISNSEYFASRTPSATFSKSQNTAMLRASSVVIDPARSLQGCKGAIVTARTALVDAARAGYDGFMDIGKDVFDSLREHLIAEIEAEALLTASHTGRSAFSPKVLATLGRAPRHEFVPVELQPY